MGVVSTFLSTTDGAQFGEFCPIENATQGNASGVMNVAQLHRRFMKIL